MVGGSTAGCLLHLGCVPLFLSTSLASLGGCRTLASSCTYTWYHILDVPNDASPRVIKEAFRKVHCKSSSTWPVAIQVSGWCCWKNKCTLLYVLFLRRFITEEGKGASPRCPEPAWHGRPGSLCSPCHSLPGTNKCRKCVCFNISGYICVHTCFECLTIDYLSLTFDYPQVLSNQRTRELYDLSISHQANPYLSTAAAAGVQHEWVCCRVYFWTDTLPALTQQVEMWQVLCKLIVVVPEVKTMIMKPVLSTSCKTCQIKVLVRCTNCRASWKGGS